MKLLIFTFLLLTNHIYALNLCDVLSTIHPDDKEGYEGLVEKLPIIGPILGLIFNLLTTCSNDRITCESFALLGYCYITEMY